MEMFQNIQADISSNSESKERMEGYQKKYKSMDNSLHKGFYLGSQRYPSKLSQEENDTHPHLLSSSLSSQICTHQSRTKTSTLLPIPTADEPLDTARDNSEGHKKQCVETKKQSQRCNHYIQNQNNIFHPKTISGITGTGFIQPIINPLSKEKPISHITQLAPVRNSQIGQDSHLEKQLPITCTFSNRWALKDITNSNFYNHNKRNKNIHIASRNLITNQKQMPSSKPEFVGDSKKTATTVHQNYFQRTRQNSHTNSHTNLDIPISQANNNIPNNNNQANSLLVTNSHTNSQTNLHSNLQTHIPTICQPNIHSNQPSNTITFVNSSNNSLQKNNSNKKTISKMNLNINQQQIQNNGQVHQNIHIHINSNPKNGIHSNNRSNSNGLMNSRNSSRNRSDSNGRKTIIAKSIIKPVIKEDNQLQPFNEFSPSHVSYLNLSQICPQAFSKEYHRSLVDQQPDLVDFLKKHEISVQLRQKMIDWMIEVVAFVFKKPTISSLFRAITLMDLYLKNTQTSVQEKRIHVIGVASLLLCNHFEQCSEVSLNTFYEDVGHKALEKKQIVAMEVEILQTLDHNLNFSVCSDFANQYIFFLGKITASTPQLLIELPNIVFRFLIQSFFFEEMMNFQPRIVSLSAVFVALEQILSQTKENYSFNTKFSSLQKAVLGEFGEGMDELMSSLAFSIKNIKLISLNFQQILPKLLNSQNKFDKFILN